jgi:hypothetical protein
MMELDFCVPIKQEGLSQNLRNILYQADNKLFSLSLSRGIVG